ncbi:MULTISPECIES: hypothetical protein [Paenibacillus]|uniref:hypothetical protein n=1 Tax=Paenibacillus TaxID=44249 RepID=UPI0022B92DF8|nr:hypothetical protein [Paenibacillus caseinilyticus]MCZ8520923.1 hypothetical protein [Paenibacillus caseinilyticus]
MYENPNIKVRDYKQLISGIELFAASLYQRHVHIWLMRPETERMLDKSGVVQGYDDEYVQIGGVRYSRAWCKFFVGSRIRA